MQVPQPDAASAFSFSTTTSHADTHTLRVDVKTFHGLYEHLGKCTKLIPITRGEFDDLPEAQQKRLKDAPCIILATFRSDNARTDADVEACTALGLDVDEAHVELAELKRLLIMHNARAIIYESVRSTPAFRRWRVIIAYKTPLTASQHERAFYYWRGIIPGVAESVRNPARVWYVPTRLKGDENRVLDYVEGMPFALNGSATVSTQDAIAKAKAAFRRIR